MKKICALALCASFASAGFAANIKIPFYAELEEGQINDGHCEINSASKPSILEKVLNIELDEKMGSITETIYTNNKKAFQINVIHTEDQGIFRSLLIRRGKTIIGMSSIDNAAADSALSVTTFDLTGTKNCHLISVSIGGQENPSPQRTGPLGSY